MYKTMLHNFGEGPHSRCGKIVRKGGIQEYWIYVQYCFDVKIAKLWSHRLILIQKMSLGCASCAAVRQSRQMLDLFWMFKLNNGTTSTFSIDARAEFLNYKLNYTMIKYF